MMLTGMHHSIIPLLLQYIMFDYQRAAACVFVLAHQTCCYAVSFRLLFGLVRIYVRWVAMLIGVPKTASWVDCKVAD